jgi:chemotaxis-related protein WspB
MRFLIFDLGHDRYGLPVRDVRRLLPLMELKRIPQAPDFVAGLMNLHGRPVPVLDLCRLACGRECTSHFDTRIVLVDYRGLPLGLIAERVSGVQEIDGGAFSDSGVDNRDARYLGRVAMHERRIVQLVEIEHLLPQQVRALLYPEPAS